MYSQFSILQYDWNECELAGEGEWAWAHIFLSFVETTKGANVPTARTNPPKSFTSQESVDFVGLGC